MVNNAEVNRTKGISASMKIKESAIMKVEEHLNKQINDLLSQKRVNKFDINRLVDKQKILKKEIHELIELRNGIGKRNKLEE